MKPLVTIIATGLLSCILLTGCAPAHFEPALAFYVNRHRVGDGGVRRVQGYGHLRFNELLISDLDEAMTLGDTSAMRRSAIEVLRAANGLGLKSACTEIDRLPRAAREQLARRAGTEASPDALKTRYRALADAEIDRLVEQVESLPPPELRRTLHAIRRRVEPAPDDRDRLLRQIMLAFGAVPAWIGVSAVESKLDAERPGKLNRVFDRTVMWRPRHSDRATPLTQYAPTIVLEWPAERSYPARLDRLGAVSLTGTPEDIDVHIDTSRPVVYTYTSEAKIHARRYAQLVYNWWFPGHPKMTKTDPAAGHIDGGVLRITLDGRGRPAIFEFNQSCGCNHVVFVSQHVEDAARAAFGTPLPGRKFVVEGEVKGKRNLIVAGAIKIPEADAHPVISILAGHHEVSDITCVVEGLESDGRATETHAYEMEDYDVLERLKLGEGVAGMFGPDGLVHNAARLEGILLAPTGILSAGQPRQRGTRRVRWDAYRFDDPHLLERALRLPEDL